MISITEVITLISLFRHARVHHQRIKRETHLFSHMAEMQCTKMFEASCNLFVQEEEMRNAVQTGYIIFLFTVFPCAVKKHTNRFEQTSTGATVCFFFKKNF